MFREWRKPERGFLDELEKELEEMNEVINSMIQTLGKEPKVYGFGMMVGPDGIPHVEHFGSVRPEERHENIVREPFTSSIIDEKNKELKVTAEMPGIQKEDIEVKATENEVAIKAESGERRYYKNIRTPMPVNPDSASANYNNGVLEVTIKIKEPPKGKTVEIK